MKSTEFANVSSERRERSDFFRWPAGILLQIKSNRLTASLEREFGAYRVTETPVDQPDAVIVLCSRKTEIPKSIASPINYYKGIPWTVACETMSDGVTRYYFYAPIFKAFLFVRACLIPILKKIIIGRGGAFLIGSAFRTKETVFICSGKPGSGKTRLLLESINRGAQFLGDSELMITADQFVWPVFPYIEARFKTLQGVPQWDRLSFQKKLYLICCHIISTLTRGFVSFNLLLESSGVTTKTELSSREAQQRILAIMLNQKAAEPEAISADGWALLIDNYEKKYQTVFGASVYTREILAAGIKQLKQLLQGAQYWSAASNQNLTEFIGKEMGA